MNQDYTKQALAHADRLKDHPPFCQKCKLSMLCIEEQLDLVYRKVYLRFHCSICATSDAYLIVQWESDRFKVELNYPLSPEPTVGTATETATEVAPSP